MAGSTWASISSLVSLGSSTVNAAVVSDCVYSLTTVVSFSGLAPSSLSTFEAPFNSSLESCSPSAFASLQIFATAARFQVLKNNLKSI